MYLLYSVFQQILSTLSTMNKFSFENNNLQNNRNNVVIGDDNSSLSIFSLLDAIWEMIESQRSIFILCIFSALFGIIFDSLLGAIFKYSGYHKKPQVVVSAPDVEPILFHRLVVGIRSFIANFDSDFLH